jgi:regulator of protease activity HflC (stomatin/prohibitin superfamily)
MVTGREDEFEARTRGIIKLVGLGFAVLVIIILLFSTFYIVNAGERAVLVTLGNPSDSIISEGLHVKIPMIQSAKIFDIKTQKDEIESSAASKDLQIVSAKVAVNYHLQEGSAPRIYKEVGVSYVDRILSPAIQESVKASTAKFTAEELITKREQVREEIKVLLVSKMEPRGITVEDVLITNFDFSSAFNLAIENKQVQVQNALAAENKLKQIEFEAKQRIVQSQAEAEAIKIQAQAIESRGGANYVQLMAISKWNGVLPIVTGGNSMPFINVNSAASTNSSN